MDPSRKRLLVIEPDDSIAELLQMVLADEGYEIVGRLAEMRDPLVISSHQPDILLLDIDVVPQSLSALLDMLASHPATSSIRVVCMSTRSFSDCLLSTPDALGAVKMPFDVDDLLRVVQRAI